MRSAPIAEVPYPDATDMRLGSVEGSYVTVGGVGGMGMRNDIVDFTIEAMVLVLVLVLDRLRWRGDM